MAGLNTASRQRAAARDPRVIAMLEALPGMIEAAGGTGPLISGNCGVLCCALLRKLQDQGLSDGVEVIIGISQAEYQNETQERFDSFAFNDVWSQELSSYEDLDAIGTVHMALMVGDAVIDAEGISDLERFHETITMHAIDHVDFLCVGFAEGEDFEETMENLMRFVSRTTAHSLSPEELLGLDTCPSP